MTSSAPSRLQETFLESFLLVDDPRAANSGHALSTVLFCVLVGIVCGADGLVQAAHYAELKRDFIARYVPLRKNKVPTHDTMGRLLAAIDPDQFAVAFATFMSRLTGRPAREIINLDGKTLRGVVGKAALKRRAAAAEDQAHMVSAFSATRATLLLSLRSSHVANEVEAAQELLQLLDIRGAIITMDAAHVTYRTMEIIAECGADVVVTVKKNSKALYDAIEVAFRRGNPTVVHTDERNHGQNERRTIEVLPAQGAAVDENFPTMRSFVRVTRENTSHSGKSSEETTTYYASSLPPDDPAEIVESIRSKWFIENKFHYVLDVTFREDRARVRVGHAAENVASMRHLAFNLLSIVKTPKKLSFELKRGTCLANESFLAKTLRLPAA